MAENPTGDRASEQDTRTILIVDDDAATRKLLRRLIEELPTPTKIYEASDGDGAINLGHNIRPDLALVDIVLPGSGASGVLVCRELCRDTRTKVVIISGQASDSVVHAALELGAVEYVRKPFALEEMREKLMGWLAS